METDDIKRPRSLIRRIKLLRVNIGSFKFDRGFGYWHYMVNHSIVRLVTNRHLFEFDTSMM